MFKFHNDYCKIMFETQFIARGISYLNTVLNIRRITKLYDHTSTQEVYRAFYISSFDMDDTG